MNERWRLTGLVFATLVLSSCGIFSDEDEALEPKQLVDFSQTLKIKRVWSAKVGGEAEFLRVALRPVGDGNRIYAAGYDGSVSAFDPESGKSLWRNKLGVRLSAGPAVGGGLVVVVTQDGSAIALESDSGALKWRTDIDGESLARPVVNGEAVVLQTIDNRMRVLSVYDGRQLWALEQSTPSLTLRGSASPVVIGTTVVGGFDNGRLVAANLLTGDVIWDSMLSPPTGRSDLDRLSDIDGSIAVVGQDLYAAGYQGRLAAVASESGQVLWSRDVSSNVGASADWSNVYTVSSDGEVVAFARRDGAEAWRNTDLLRREPTLPIAFNTTVAVGDLEGYVHFFSNLSGNPVARIRQGNAAISNAPVVVANKLYVQSDSGVLAAYEVLDSRPERTVPDTAVDES